MPVYNRGTNYHQHNDQKEAYRRWEISFSEQNDYPSRKKYSSIDAGKFLQIDVHTFYFCLSHETRQPEAMSPALPPVPQTIAKREFAFWEIKAR